MCVNGVTAAPPQARSDSHISGSIEPGEAPGIEAAPKDGGRVERAPLGNIRDRMLLGGPSHKDVIKSFFDAVREKASDLPGADSDWSDMQAAMRTFSKDQTGIDALSDKEKNYLLVANIMNNKAMIQSAASFFTRVAKAYADKAEVKTDINPEVKHGWPNNDLDSTHNLGERGWAGMAKGVIKSHVGMDNRTLADGLKDFSAQMDEISKQVEPLSLEQTAFVLRGSAVLRDVMKAVKKTDTKEFVDANGLHNIVVKGVEGRSYLARSRVTAHTSPQRSPSVRVEATDSMLGKVAVAAEDRFHAGVDKWDYNQGPSGTTLDFENFCLMFLVNEDGKPLAEAKEITLGLMQVMYAYWHFCAPDGMAHSQDESISTMLASMFDVELTTPIVAPIRSSADVEAMQRTETPNAEDGLHYCETPETVRTVHVPGGFQPVNA